MSTTPEGIVAHINEASKSGFRGSLLARGQARAIIWRSGVPPDDAPKFAPSLSYDLKSYGFALIGQGLRLLDLGGEPAQARIAFEKAANAIEAVIVKGDPKENNRNFYFVMAAASYHLAHLSARAYSLLTIIEEDENFTPVERILVQLMRRDFTNLRTVVLDYRASDEGGDQNIVSVVQEQLDSTENLNDSLDEDDELLFEAIDIALTDFFFAAMSLFLLALERGEKRLLDKALKRLRRGLVVSRDMNMLPQWWSHRIAVHLLSDLWLSTFHTRLPRQLPIDKMSDWPMLRELFIAVLYQRAKSEIDLWPSQFEAAIRAVDQSDDLVVSLPTSAGKTRIAELCILRCLASAKRIVFVTPLRALSAQTEVVLQRTFGPLGKTISALYGSMGVSGFDEDAIRRRDIVVATPEKLDFALRNDPSLLNDVGLLVFDEGHMIGLGEREVRYEVHIQRLLRRSDAGERRIVCLSAILPEGEQLDDFSAWLRRDRPGKAIKSDWRPTRLRFGEVLWRLPDAKHARLELVVDDERPWLQKYITGVKPANAGKRRLLFPKDKQELTLAISWRLVKDGQTVLVYCPDRRSVEAFPEVIIRLHKQGALEPLLEVEQEVLNTAIAIGEEWLGSNSAILDCLRLGVAFHHGALPTAFRREVERLLRENCLKVTISSPTLAQGLNLPATAIVMHSIYRHGEPLRIWEFRNIVGRAGRAYKDVEGLVLFPIFEKPPKMRKMRRAWKLLIEDQSSREMQSGLVQLLSALLARMSMRTDTSIDELLEYVVNHATDWEFPEVEKEKSGVRLQALNDWERNISTLDTAILSLIGENEIPENKIEDALDDILKSSLWTRHLQYRREEDQRRLNTILVARSRFIWSQSTARQRYGYYLAGIGLKAGRRLDAIASIANPLLVEANGAILNGEEEVASAAITELARHVFAFLPFKPEVKPKNWREILHCWLSGKPLSRISAKKESEVSKFIENEVVYRLSWAMESVRVRAVANEERVGTTDFSFEDLDLNLAVSAVETGTLNRSASILIQAGFGSRIAAIKAVTDTDATFESSVELQQWLNSEEVAAKSAQLDWPTAETNAIWIEFMQSIGQGKNRRWTDQRYWAKVKWLDQSLESNTHVHIHHLADQLCILSADGALCGTVNAALNPNRLGLLRASVGRNRERIDLSYLGPNDLFSA